jgi:hypothetical protein
MSGKNRAFALAAATAALVGLSAPVAGAATLQGPSGFNNDSILNLSGNQIPIAACNLGIPVNALLAQVPISALNFVGAGMLNSTTMSPTNTQTCSPSTTQGNTSTTNTNSGNASVPTTSIRHITVYHGRHHSVSATTINTPADNGPSGFNGDSVLNVSNNQIPATICNVAVPITATGVQAPVSILNAVLGSGAALNSTTLNPSNTQTCTPSANQDNSSTFNTNSNNGHNG